MRWTGEGENFFNLPLFPFFSLALLSLDSGSNFEFIVGFQSLQTPNFKTPADSKNNTIPGKGKANLPEFPVKLAKKEKTNCFGLPYFLNGDERTLEILVPFSSKFVRGKKDGKLLENSIQKFILYWNCMKMIVQLLNLKVWSLE